MPRVLALIPIAWASLGGQAAFLLGVRTDLVLLASGVIMLVYVLGSSSRVKDELTSHRRDAVDPSAFQTPQGEAAFLAAYDAALKRWPVPYEEMDVPTPFGTTHVVASGPKDASPLVLLHGYWATSTIWAPNIADFSKDHRVYAVDVIGQPSKSVPTESIRNAAAYVEWLDATLAALHLDHISLVGMSFGGWLALAYAVAASKHVQKLVLLSPGGLLPMVRRFKVQGMLMLFVPSRVSVNSFMHWLGFTEENTRLVLELMYLGLKHFRVPARVMPTVFSDEELRAMRVPTLLLLGDHEVMSDPTRALERARRLIPDVEGALVPGCRHDMCSSQYDIVDARVLDFLKKTGEDRAATIERSVA
jgi:pimeloyl-ACP methyl ester carboxylesterase